MQTEIIVVLIASIASLIIGVVNVIYNTKISAKQNEIDLKKTRIELLETRRKTIEAVKGEVSNRTIDLSDVGNIRHEDYYSKGVDYFKKTSLSILSIGHLLNTDFIGELKSLNRRLDDYTLKAKQNIPIDEKEVKSDLAKIFTMNSQIEEELDISLVRIEREINMLLK